MNSHVNHTIERWQDERQYVCLECPYRAAQKLTLSGQGEGEWYVMVRGDQRAHPPGVDPLPSPVTE